MIKLLIAGLFVLIAENANAASNESIYKVCKKFASSGFDESTTDALACTMYFLGVRDAYDGVCSIYEGSYETLSESEKYVFEFFALKSSENLHASIQDYVNKMQQKPENWGYGATFDVGDSLRKMSPCKPK
ncbi:MAG: hypothetical protein ISP40_03685 [Alphaproteobacteria bacterium]|nr:hypothetical protein [Alphaproteobacteria bacterium]